MPHLPSFEDHHTYRIGGRHKIDNLFLEIGGKFCAFRKFANFPGRRHFETGKPAFHIAEAGRTLRIIPEQYLKISRRTLVPAG